MPFTLNSAEKSTRGGRRFKTKEFKQWQAIAEKEVNRYKKQLQMWGSNFDRKKHIVEVQYVWHIPFGKLFTKKLEMSYKSGDTDNYIKPINDIIFRAAGVEDSVVYNVSAKKVPDITAKIFFGARIVNMLDVSEYQYFLEK